MPSTLLLAGAAYIEVFLVRRVLPVVRRRALHILDSGYVHVASPIAHSASRTGAAGFSIGSAAPGTILGPFIPFRSETEEPTSTAELETMSGAIQPSRWGAFARLSETAESPGTRRSTPDTDRWLQSARFPQTRATEPQPTRFLPLSSRMDLQTHAPSLWG